MEHVYRTRRHTSKANGGAGPPGRSWGGLRQETSVRLRASPCSSPLTPRLRLPSSPLSSTLELGLGDLARVAPPRACGHTTHGLKLRQLNAGGAVTTESHTETVVHEGSGQGLRPSGERLASLKRC